jgi:tellurite resistance protein TehA-like permease
MVGIAEMRMALLVPIVVTATTPLCLLKLVATFLRLAAVLTVAVDCLSEIFLGLVNALVAFAVVIARLRTCHTARQQQYS